MQTQWQGNWAAPVRKRIVISILLRIHAVQANINSIQLLKQQDNLLAVVEACGVGFVLECVIKLCLGLCLLCDIIDHSYCEAINLLRFIQRFPAELCPLCLLLIYGLLYVLFEVSAELGLR